MAKSSAWAEKRGQKYLARYRDEMGRTKSAGTYPSRDQALAAAERRCGLGEVGDYLDLTLEEYILHWRDSRLGEERIEQPMKWAHYKTLNRYVLPQYGRTKIREFEANPWLAHKIVGSILDHPKARPTSRVS